MSYPGPPLVTCEECEGRGYIDKPEEQVVCPTCDGTGLAYLGEGPTPVDDSETDL